MENSAKRAETLKAQLFLVMKKIAKAVFRRLLCISEELGE